VGSGDYKLYAFNAATRAPLWAAPTGSFIYSSPVVASGVVYVGSGDHKLYAYSLAAGLTASPAAAPSPAALVPNLNLQSK
jgi:outer membrane protein assembly factor BamB